MTAKDFALADVKNKTPELESRPTSNLVPGIILVAAAICAVLAAIIS